jgi:hypothetical protein
MPSAEAHDNRKKYLIERILATPIDMRNEYVAHLEGIMKDLQKWHTIVQASEESEHFIDLIEGLDSNESWRFCERLDDVSKDVELEKIINSNSFPNII